MRLLAIVFLAVLGMGAALAQDYPSKPVRLVVPWPAGGITDAAGRVLANQLTGRFASPVVVENKPGATGMIGAAVVSQSTGDGYTLLLASAETHGINPHTYRKLTYDPVKDFVAIAPFAINPFAVVVRGEFPASSINQLIDLAKASPGKYTYSSAGLGSTSQLAMEIFRMQAGVELLHVPFQGEAPAVTALMSGQTDMQILPAGRAEALRKSGKLKVLAVTTADRYFALKDVPTLKEAGYDKVNLANWFALVAPVKTPAAVVDRLYAEVQAIVKSAEGQAAFRGLGLDVYAPVALAEFQQFVASEPARWGDVIRRANIKLEQ